MNFIRGTKSANNGTKRVKNGTKGVKNGTKRVNNGTNNGTICTVIVVKTDELTIKLSENE